jgi:hypothetical protein
LRLSEENNGKKAQLFSPPLLVFQNLKTKILGIRKVSCKYRRNCTKTFFDGKKKGNRFKKHTASRGEISKYRAGKTVLVRYWFINQPK